MKQFALAVSTALAGSLVLAAPASAAPKWGDPVTQDGLVIDPIVDARLRYERVETTLDGDALTLRLRAGAELRHPASGFSLLAEGEGTAALVNDYNAFPFAIVDRQRRPQFATVADPQNVEINRLQLQYKSKAVTFTIGRQRINLDDQRWVGSVGWRQNEQTFDAVRGEAKFGPVAVDGTYSRSQRTIFGLESGPRAAYDGDFGFLGAGGKVGPVQLKAFAYLLDYDTAEQAGTLAIPNADTQTYGLRAAATFPLAPATKLTLTGSYARQSDFQDNPFDYAADYLAGEAAVTYRSWGLTAGYEQLGSAPVAPGVRRAVQTPMATLHKFNGWADLFLTTPNNGLEDIYVTLGKKFDGIKALPGLTANVTWHRYDSDFGSVRYGEEWNASLGFKLGMVALLAKYADYDASGFGADTRKLWLQGEVSF